MQSHVLYVMLLKILYKAMVDRQLRARKYENILQLVVMIEQANFCVQ